MEESRGSLLDMTTMLWFGDEPDELAEEDRDESLVVFRAGDESTNDDEEDEEEDAEEEANDSK